MKKILVIFLGKPCLAVALLSHYCSCRKETACESFASVQISQFSLLLVFVTRLFSLLVLQQNEIVEASSIVYSL